MIGVFVWWIALLMVFCVCGLVVVGMWFLSWCCCADCFLLSLFVVVWWGVGLGWRVLVWGLCLAGEGGVVFCFFLV